MIRFFLTACIFIICLLSKAFAIEKLDSMVLLDTSGAKIDVVRESYKSPLILVRYLGASCSKCLHQLNILNAVSDTLKKYNIRVFGFSNDDIKKNKMILKQAKFKGTAISLYSDIDGKAALRIGAAIPEKNGETTELHATLILYKGEIFFTDIDAKPYMQVGRLFEKILALKE